MEGSSLLVRIRNDDNAEYINTLLRREKINLHSQKCTVYLTKGWAIMMAGGTHRQLRLNVWITHTYRCKTANV